ncbi:MAG TPA: SpoIID/LytB domain-containing protein [Pyrinomonadaceae bacterium]|nr:SpoIID/LytB domain-containing protein [Pyrinomonadaceae bacterium]
MTAGLKFISLLLLFAILSAAPAQFAWAQETRERSTSAPKTNWPADPKSPVRTATDNASTVTLSAEPVMRIALSTGTGAATISTTAQLLAVSDLDQQNQALATTRVRVESRMLSVSKPVSDHSYEMTLAASLSREEADRLSESVRQNADEQPQVVTDSADKWKVVIQKETTAQVEEARAKLDDAGFEVLAVKDTQKQMAANLNAKSALPNSAAANKIKYTARAASPSRELIAFARGTAPSLRSSAPLVFASSDEKNAPVRFNDKPYRGKIEVFANTHGSVTVVNVIGLEDYVRGVVPNELSYPALEALKAQAIAARTYAVKNRGQFASEGFDLLPTTRSQVYRGLTSETSLTSQAVEQTRGVIATYNGEPINALYTSTCGGRTEDAGNIFNEPVPYLRGRECAVEGRAAFAPFTIKSSRDLFEIKDERDLGYARDVAVLAVSGFSLPVDKVSSSWLSGHMSESEARDWLTATARLARNPTFKAPDDAAKVGGFSTALMGAVYADHRADTLLNSADADYLLSFRDGEEVPLPNRADVAMLLRDGALSLFADATLKPKEAMPRSHALHAIAHLLEAKNLLALQKGTSRPAASGTMILRSNKGKDMPIAVNSEVFLFREFGENLHQMKSLALVGGETVVFHVSPSGQVDYLEVRPANNGAAADRFSSLSNWTAQMNLGAVQARLGRSVRGIGAITDLRIAKQGSSRRVIDLEVIGTQGTAHIRGGRIRSALGLKEQLFVIDRVYNDGDRVASFIFTGRGWGHGVGMCQFGAYGLAKQGLNVEQILKTYYTGIELTKLY